MSGTIKRRRMIRQQLILFLFLSLLANPVSSLGVEKKGETNVSPRKPEVLMSPSIPIQDEERDAPSWLSRNKWWVALGAVILGGSAVALSGNGGSGDSGDGNDEENGSYSAVWE